MTVPSASPRCSGPSQILALIAAIHSSSKPNMLLGATSGLFTQKEFDQVKGEIGGDVFTTFTYALPTAQVSGPVPSNHAAVPLGDAEVRAQRGGRLRRRFRAGMT